MKVYKIELMVIDHDDIGIDDIETIITNSKYVYPEVISVDERDIEWTDEHPLNMRISKIKAFKELFGEPND